MKTTETTAHTPGTLSTARLLGGRRALAGFALAAAFTLSACTPIQGTQPQSASAQSGPEQSGPAQSGPAQSGSEQSGSQSGSASSVGPSPLAVFFAEIPGMDGVLTSGTPTQVLEEHQRFEEAVSRCMAAAGFEYIPAPHPSASDSGNELGTLAYAERVGYGITASVAPQPGQEQSPADPNQSIVDSLTPEERRTYNNALWGVVSSTGDAADAKPGCVDSAQLEVQSEQEPDLLETIWANPTWSSLLENMVALRDEAGRDPRANDANEKWSGCMAAEGLGDFASPSEAIESITILSQEMLEKAKGEPDGFPSAQAVRQLRERELSVAVQDARCREKTGYGDSVLQVQYALEREFIDANQEELSAMLEGLKTP